MRNLLYTGIVALALGTAAAGGFYFAKRDPELRRAARERDALAWLRTEYRLTPAQEAAIVKLQSAYAVVCTEHCLAIEAARRRAAPAPEMAALEKLCTDAMRTHFTEVAGQMSPPEGERYLAEVLPRIDRYGHTGAPTSRVTP